MIRLSLVALVLMTQISCAQNNVVRARLLFQEEIILDNIGKDVGYLQSNGYFVDSSLTKVKKMDDSTELYIYENFHGAKLTNPYYYPCDVFFMVNIKDNKIVDGYSKGKGCGLPIN